MGTAIVTGAGGGIGAVIAAELASRGFAVTVADIDGDAAAAVAHDIGGTAVRVDVTDESDVDRLFAGIEARVDVLINNAGVVHVDPFTELPADVFDRVLRVNLRGTFLMTRAAARTMATQIEKDGRRGLVVNISSAAADIARPNLAAYGASKAAVNHLSRSAAAALADDGIGVTVVYPRLTVRSGTWTDVADRLAAAEGRTRAELEAEREFGAPEHVAASVLHVVETPGLALSGHIVTAPGDSRPI